MSVVILADSQGLPRAKGWGNVPYEATYPYQLDRKLRARLSDAAPIIVDRSLRGRTVRHVVRDWEEEVELKGARLVILHVGGSDCAPRILKPREQEWMARFPSKKVRRWITRFQARHRQRILRWMPDRVCVQLEEFERDCLHLARRAAEGGRKLVLVNIARPTQHIGDLSPGLLRNIARYNAALERVAEHGPAILVDMNEILPGDAEQWTVDGVHFNREGHERLAARLEEIVLSCERSWREAT